MTNKASLESETLDRRHLVVPEDESTRADAIWTRLEGDRRRRVPASVGALCATAAVAAAALLMVAPQHPKRHADLPSNSMPRKQESASDSPSGDATALSGVSYKVSPEARVRITQEGGKPARLSLEQGTADLRVSRQAGEPLEVELGESRLRIVRARARVTRTAFLAESHTAIEVTSGEVVVLDGAMERRLSAGQTAILDTPRGGDDAETTQEPRTGAQAPTSNVDTPSRSASKLHEPSAKALFDEASSDLSERNYAFAARGYAALVDRYPRDSRAPLAAFVLARVRMDKLSDPRGGIEALHRALSMSKALPFQEEAMERLVRAYDALGDERACKMAREQYLKHFSKGRYVSSVMERCAARQPLRP